MSRPRARLRRELAAAAGAALSGLLAAACGGPGLPSQVGAPRDPTPLSKCQVAASQSSPLVTEWSAPEKARLEGLLAQGGVAVRYSGCEMTVLDGCRVEGRYAFQRTTLSTDMLEIRSADELYAKLPLGAASLEGELGRSGRLAIRTTISGQLLFQGQPEPLPPAPACAGATHVITAISVGTFKMLSGGAVGAGGGIGVAGAGAGGKVSRAEEVLKQAGNPERCAEAADGAAHPECSSPIQVFLTPVTPPAVPPPTWAGQPWGPPPGPPPGQGTVPQPPPQAQPQPQPQPQPYPQPYPQPPQYPPPPQGPPQQQSAIYVRIPALPEGSWVVQDELGAAVCQLPCAAWLDRQKDYVLRGDGGRSKIALPSLMRVPGAEADVEMLPPRGSKVLGIVGISVGGAAVITGLVLFMSGALDEDVGPVPGLLVSTAGLGITTAGIVYTVYSRSNYKPEYKTFAGRDAAPSFRLGLGLGTVGGEF